MGVLTEEGRALSKARGDGFSASSWLENDGDPVEQAVAAGRLPTAPRGSVRALEVSGVKVLHATGKSASEAARRACREADLIVVNVPLAETRDCLVFDAKRLAETGALALYADEDGLRVVPARDPARARLWSQ